MAKPKFIDTNVMEIEGILDLENMEITVEGIDEPVSLSNAIQKFDGQNIRVTVKLEKQFA